jgi:hypothetical protein
MSFCIDDSNNFFDTLFKNTSFKRFINSKKKTQLKDDYRRKINKKPHALHKYVNTNNNNNDYYSDYYNNRRYNRKYNRYNNQYSKLKLKHNNKFSKLKNKRPNQYYYNNNRNNDNNNNDNDNNNNTDKDNNNNNELSKNLKWLHQYVYKRAADIVNDNFDNFSKLYYLFQETEREIRYDISDISESDISTNMEKIMSLSNKYISDQDKELLSQFVSYNCTSINIEYINQIMNGETVIGHIQLYYNSYENMEEINKIIFIVLKIIGFYIKYIIGNKYFNRYTPDIKVPNIQIYYINKPNCINTNNSNFSDFRYNSDEQMRGVAIPVFTTDDTIVIYRKEELVKNIIHELQRFYSLDFGSHEIDEFTIYLKILLQKTYNVYMPNISQDDPIFNPNKSYLEVNATVLQTIFLTNTFNKKNLITNFFTEMLFSLYQTAKLFNSQNIKSSIYIYKNANKSKEFLQYTSIFEYYYLKTKLFFKYDDLLNFINKYNNSSKTLFLKMKFPKKIMSRHNQFIKFGEELLIQKDQEWHRALDIIIKLRPDDINLRMTKLDIEF